MCQGGTLNKAGSVQALAFYIDKLMFWVYDVPILNTNVPRGTIERRKIWKIRRLKKVE